MPDVDFVLNLGDAPKVLPLPARAGRPSQAGVRATAASFVGDDDGGDGGSGSHGGSGDGSLGAVAASAAELATLASPPACAGFTWPELAHAPHGPFGALRGTENMLHANGFANKSASARLPPLMTATSCCFATDLSFPTVW